jgi:preprotein translocase subunit SecG
VSLIIAILLHSGKDTGLSGAFGVGGAGSGQGGSMMEKNLNRFTVALLVVFLFNALLMIQVGS